MKIIYNLFLSWINLLRSLEEKESLILIKNLPRWYYTFQYSFFFRACRLLAMLVIASSWYHIYILQLIVYCEKKLNISFVIQNNVELYLSIYWVLFFFSIIFLFVYCVFFVLIRIILFNRIIRNSPISIMQCISTGLRICRYSSYGVGLLLGIPGIDYVFEMNGHIRPLRGFYLKRHIQFFGANEVNCALSEGKKMSQTGLVSNSLGVLQEYTENRERIANTAFNIAINNNVTNITEAVVEALSK